MDAGMLMQWFEGIEPQGYTKKRENEDYISVETEKACGGIRIYHLESDICELQLTRRCDGENIFFLHFELKDEDHARKLVMEMISCLIAENSRRTASVLLSCTSGMTTSFFAEKLNETAALLSMDIHYDAVSLSRLYTEGFKYDMILLAPQIGYQLKKIKEIFAPKPVIMIPAQVFASYNGGELNRIVNEELRKAAENRQSQKIAKVMRDIEMNACIFIINATHDIGETRYITRLYDKGDVIFSREYVRREAEHRDIIDILDTTLLALKGKYRIDAIAISIPNILYRGSELQKITYSSLSEEFSQYYKIPVFFENNTNAVAHGYYVQQNTYDSVTYHSQPRGTVGGGQGTVIRGHLIEGAHHMAGEVSAVTEKMLGKMESTRTDDIEKIKESVIDYLLVNIAVADP